MPEHGHDECPHCDAALVGSEATCPACSGPLFGIAPKAKPEAEPAAEPEVESVAETQSNGHSEMMIDDVVVSTYTPEETAQPEPVAEPEPEIEVAEAEDEDATDLIRQGEALGLEGQHAEAILAFNRAIALDPSNHMAWFNRGVMNEALGDVDGALKAFRIALDNHSEHGATSANLAVLLERLGHLAEAGVHAQAGLIAFPGHPGLIDIVNRAGGEIPVAQIAEVVEEESDPEPEEPVIEEEQEDAWAEPTGFITKLESTAPAAVAESTGFDLDALAEAAADLIRAGDAASALESLRDHLPEAAADHAPCWRIAAGAMARLDLADSAIEAFTYAIDLDDTDAPAWFNLGALKRRGGDHGGAADCFANALKLDPQYAKAANGLALAQLETGQVEPAISTFRTLLSLDPGHASAATFTELLIDLAEGEGRVLEFDFSVPNTLPAGPEMAAEALRHISAEASPLRARALSLRGDHSGSVTTWKELLVADKLDADLWIGLARALTAAGSEDKAAACRQKARELGGDIAEPEPLAEPEPQLHIESHETILDTVEEPERVTYESVTEEVDLASAALQAQAGVSDIEMHADSSSVANQDIEWYNKGLELLNQDKYREALSCFDRALPSFKDDKAMAIKILNGRGNCFYYLDKYKEAIEAYYKAFSIDKGLTTGNALYNMGTAYAELESYDNGIHCFEQAMGRDIGEPLRGENKKRCKEQIRRCKLLLKEQKKKKAQTA